MKKRMLSLILVVVMVLSMAACGGDKPSGSNAANNAASKEGVFEVVDLEAIADTVDADDFNISQMKAIGDTLYMIADVYFQDDKSNGYRILYLTADMEGNVKTQHTIYEQIWQNYEDKSEVEEAVPLEKVVASNDIAVLLPEEPVVDEAVYEDYHNIYSYQIMSDGKLAYVDSLERYNKETELYETTLNIVVCDENGTELVNVNLSEGLDPEEYLWVNCIVESGEGTLFALCYEKIFEISMDGNVLGTFEGNEVTQNLYTPAFYKDGTPVFTTWNADWTKQSYSVVDIRQGAIVEELDVLDTLQNYTVYDGANSGYQLVLANNTGVYGYNFGDTDPKLIMDYINSDLATYRVRYVCFKDADHFIGIYDDIVDYNNHVASFTKIPPENVPDRNVLTMATYGTDSNVTKAIIDFNKASDEYKILVKDYSQYSTSEDWYAGMTKLDNDIISGNIPDIIKGNEQISLANYASKGLLEDFYKLMEKDESINMEDYAENVFKAFEVDGKLYELPTQFYIWTVYGKTSIWGEESGITWDEVAAVQAQYPEAALFSEMTKSRALSDSLRYNYAQLVDEASGECHFNSDIYKNILEFANTFPAEINYDELYSDDDYWLHYQTQYMEDKTLLTSSTIYSVYEAWSTVYRTFNEEGTPVGFPTDEGKGSVISALNSYAISAKSDYVDGAWEFVKSFISEENQIAAEDTEVYSYWGIPVMKKGIEQQAMRITQKPYWIDENGEKVEYDDYIWLGEEQIVMEPATEKEAQRWVDFILSVDQKANFNFEDAMEIISEEAEGYFSGDRKIEDVMSNTQSRMSIFTSVNN